MEAIGIGVKKEFCKIFEKKEGKHYIDTMYKTRYAEKV